MDTILLREYGQVISDSDLGNTIFNDINLALERHQNVVVDFDGVISMATFCSKQIFGSLYVKLSPQEFFEKIRMINVSHDMRIIVRLGIEKALADKTLVSS